MTQNDFALQLGITASYISRLEKGSSTPSLALVKYICNVYNVTPEWLKGRDDAESRQPEFICESSPENYINHLCLGISDELISSILKFRDERNWKQFHNPKDLAISISLEAAELLENFQWSGIDVKVLQKHEQIKEELADVLIYSILMTDAIGVNLEDILRRKLDKNGKKYDVSKAYGTSKKYTQLEGRR